MNKQLVRKFSSGKILVVGDLMLDRYWSGSSSRVSPEAPVPVVKVDGEFERLGGCGNVAANISALGAEACLLAVIGDDEAAESVERLAKEQNIRPALLKDHAEKTTVKLRVISQQQQLLRVDFEQPCRAENVAQAYRQQFESFIDNVGALVISDYGKGGIVETSNLISLARARNVPTIVDPKGGDFEKYRGATLVTPNFGEFVRIVGECPNEGDLEDRARNLIAELDIESLLVTQGDKGMTLVQSAAPTLHLSADSREVFDVTGAGDTVCGVCAAAVAAEIPLNQAVTLANCAAGIVVGKFGTATVSADELLRELDKATNTTHQKIYDEATLTSEITKRKNRGARIVMTNGCFDVLHAGHVEYLQRARALGDLLIVAVNSDGSVKRLKGDGRPVNAVEHRLTVLAGLESVDALITFDEDTPQKLIAKLLPDVLVKGGDYVAEQVVGAREVV
ncbi:MAG: bifunctional D-glycero-beta-D-manno-heptose-7-phosphate kinase/D-glycero-beta-D-manno-heptose 1-phosphate adenylyltransferase HldE, partial [Pseudomonadota bacterium]